MKANNFRIGNIVQDSNGVWNFVLGTQILLKQENEIGVCYNGTGDIMWHKESKWIGIPLTEEWLVKFGFEKRKAHNGCYFINEWFELTKNIHGGFSFEFENYEVEIPDVHLKYIHQLQNLYFALTGEELELK
jgi:hypothetical protein